TASYPLKLPDPIAWALTLGFVMVAWVPFRADSLSATFTIWKGMFGFQGLVPAESVLAGRVTTAVMCIAVLLAGLVCSQHPTALVLSACPHRRPSTANSLCSIASMGHRRGHRFRNCGIVHHHAAPDRISLFPILIMKSLFAWRWYVALFILCAAL